MATTAPASTPRERLLRTATDLFYREGIHAVGVDRILAEAGVTRATMYRHFKGKEDLVEAYLAVEDETIRGYFAAAEAAAGPDTDLLELVIDGIAEDVARYHTRGCPFINAAAEYPDPDSRIRRLITEHRRWFRAALEQAAAGHAHAPEIAASLALLRDAALVGGYLDGIEYAKPAFVRAARQAAGLPAQSGHGGV
ncbi:TetR/AcrR family transcriptional regulator [Mycolicibacterium cosmeticum]|uniref:TetR family transcriptional regulator n=1 Tax=Mycolicibacterium cosmeticum TaxID=258533 RepID=W9BGJ7_MYCCO|nr:TetR/AcrR family transcriptional regulator [Mycolicibacterium cosmeticum]TLH72724.1 TetR/AcrR family transcriptional regulator [Mycolicibacterium cosmeticum]CDO05630.1 TetR family transcriptional regulator [Mycolicibacterium cosmeticum]